MSSRISAKASDAKATVSFNSDSEDDDDNNSASSRLSSSGEDDVSDVETVTFSVSLAPKTKGETAASARVADGERLQREPGRGTRAADRDAASPTSRLSPNKVEVAEMAEKTAASEHLDLGLIKKSTKSSMEEAGDELTVTKTNIENTGRARSPKITINDVDSAEVETDATGSEKVSKKTRGSSPKKIASNESNEDFNSYSAPASRSASERARSPHKSASEDEVEFSRPVGKSSKVISGLDFDETAPEDPTKKKSSKSSSFGSGDGDAERARSPKKSSEERELPRAKSPKKTSGEIDENRAKSPKKKATSEDKDFLRETSPRHSSKEGKRKSSKDPGKALDDLIRSTESPDNSPKGNTRLEVNQDADDAKESSTKVKKTKKTKHSKHEDGKAKEDRPAKVTADKTDGEISSERTGERLHRKELAKTEDLGLFYGNNLVEDDGKDRRLNFSKYGLDPGKSESETGKSRLDDDFEVSREIANYKRSELNRSPEGGDDVTVGKTRGATLEGKIAEGTGNESPSRDLNHLKVDAAAAADNAKELVNEDSDFTYRRKSMDDFIKRILAEAREEKLKQKQVVLKNESTATETNRWPDEQNGDVQREIRGKPPRWNGSAAAAADKEKSNLDKRLASIEKRRFGGNESTKEDSSKVKDEDGKRESVQNDTNDLDMNLDEDLEEINRFLQSRKSAAARFDDYDDGETTTTTTTNDHSSAPTVAKQADDGGSGEQTVVDLPTEAVTKPDIVPASSGTKPKSHKAMKKYGVDLNLDDDDDDGRFLARFKRERDAMLSETLFSPRRRDETDEVVRERTRNVRVLVDQQVDIIQSMRNTSKSLDELEKEIREARQVCLDRQVRIEALEGALGAEFRTYESTGSQTAGSEGSLKDELGRLRRQGKLSGESADDDGFWFRRRSGSVASVGSFGSAFGGGGGGGGSDLSDVLRPPPSGYRPPRGPDLRRSEFEAEFQEIDRRRAGSVNRDHRGFDINPFSPPGDDTAKLLLNQRSARSRASIATSNPTLDLTSGDGFLAKIRAKYSFLAPSIDSSGYLGSSGRNQGGVSSYGTTAGIQSSLDLKYSRTRSSFDDAKLRTKDFLTSSSPSYAATGGYTPTHTPSYYSVRDSRSPAGGGGGGGGFAAGVASWDRMRRAQSVSEFSFDRPSAASGHGGGGGGGGEFHSRFLDKVRERKASIGDEQTTTPKGQGQGQGQDKPFKSRFLRTSSFDSSGSRSDRVTNGEGSEVTVDG